MCGWDGRGQEKKQRSKEIHHLSGGQAALCEVLDRPNDAEQKHVKGLVGAGRAVRPHLSFIHLSWLLSHHSLAPKVFRALS